jgi:hypothetical protein
VVLTDLVLAELTDEDWNIVIGGLGSYYPAAAALKYDRGMRLIVVREQIFR